MRISAEFGRQTKARPDVSLHAYPDGDTEVRVVFYGATVWLSESEATRLGQELIEAGIRIRAEETKE